MKNKNVTALWGVNIGRFFLFWAELFLLVRFILHFFAVNPTNGFAAWIFNSTNALVEPFRAVFPTTVVGHPHFVDLETLFVMLGYAVFVSILAKVVAWSHSASKK